MPCSVNQKLLASLLALACLQGLSACSADSKAQQNGAAKTPEVAVVTLAEAPLAVTTELAGRTTPYLIAEVRPQINGIVQKRNFVEGGEVRAGEALYQIDPATYDAAEASARATLARAEASLATAKAKAARYADLVKINAVSQQDDDDASAALKQGEADVLAARAALKTAQINLAYTRVASPISGRIGKSSVTPGALVTANQAATLTTVQQLDPIYVDVTQSSADLLRLKRELADGALKQDDAGQAKVKLRLEDGSLYPLEGKLQFSDLTVDQNTGMVTVRAVFPNPQKLLLPGMYVRAVMEEGIKEKALAVPQQGVTRNTKGEPVVMLVGADNKVEARTIKTSRTIGDKWLVSDGLKAGDRVIVEGLQKIRPGVPVTVVDAAAPQAAASAPTATK